MGQKLRVLFVASEGVPFAKTGGLADIVGTLPQALEELGVEVKVLMPYYGMVKQGKVPTTLIAEDLEVNLGLINHPFNLMAPTDPGSPFYFVERDEFYERSQLYGTPRGDYFDNLERFAFFSGAVLPFCRALDFHPDLIHCHDWQSALVPVYLRHRWAGEDILAGAKTVFTIHNLAYQGLFPRDKYPLLGLDWSFFSIDGLEYYGQINLLKGGIVGADAVTTVSPTYSREIQTPEFGCGLEGVLRTRAEQLHGILNGVDYQDWSPETDSLIPAKFSRKDLKGKAAKQGGPDGGLWAVPGPGRRPYPGHHLPAGGPEGVRPGGAGFAPAHEAEADGGHPGHRGGEVPPLAGGRGPQVSRASWG